MSAGPFIAHAAMHAAGQALQTVLRPTEQLTNSVASHEVPSPEVMFDLFNRQYVTAEDVDKVNGYRGVATQVSAALAGQPVTGLNKWHKGIWNQVFLASGERPTVTEYLEISNRRLAGDPATEFGLTEWGFRLDDTRKAVANLRYDIPGPADLVRFSVRHCWEPDLLARLGYNSEFPGPIIDLWHAMKGLDYGLFTGPFKAQVAQMLGGEQAAGDLYLQYVTLTGVEPTWARFYWYSHWVLPSPTQGYLMWQRLNPARNPRWDGPEMRGINFSYQDLELLLRANDYPPYYRGKLAAISRPIPGIRYARQFATNGVYNWRDLYDWTQRQGYSDGDGIDIADSIWADAQKSIKKAVKCQGCKDTLAAYQVGLLTRADAVAALTGYGVDPAEAQQQVDQAGNEQDIRRAKEVVAAVRRQFLLGGLDGVGARQLLLNFGLVADRIDLYIQDWELERQFKFREVSASKLVDWACKGFIDATDLDRRLTALNYDASSRAGLVADAAYCQAQLAARATASLAKQERQNQRDLVAAQKAAAKAYRDLAQLLAGRATPKDLQKWWCDGLIGDQEVYYRLTHLGWPLGDITRLLETCKSGRKPGGQPQPVP